MNVMMSAASIQEAVRAIRNNAPPGSNVVLSVPLLHRHAIAGPGFDPIALHLGMLEYLHAHRDIAKAMANNLTGLHSTIAWPVAPSLPGTTAHMFRSSGAVHLYVFAAGLTTEGFAQGLVNWSGMLEFASTAAGMEDAALSLELTAPGLWFDGEAGDEDFPLDHFPMLNSRPHSYLRELQVFLQNGAASSYEDEGLSIVAVPLLQAKEALGAGDFHGARAHAIECQDPAWRAAAVWWIDQRFAERQERKQ